MVYTPWPNRLSSVFDLVHIGELSTTRTIPLLLSPQVLYALQNLAVAEIADPNHYAVGAADGGYYRLQESDADEFLDFLEIVSQTGLQLSDYLSMSTPLNYKSELSIQVANTNASAGTNTLEIQGPDGGEAWVIEQFAMIDVNSNPSIVNLDLGFSGTLIPIVRATSPGAGAWVLRTGPFHLSGGMLVQASFGGCNAGDDLYIRITGYIMELIA